MLLWNKVSNTWMIDNIHKYIVWEYLWYLCEYWWPDLHTDLTEIDMCMKPGAQMWQNQEEWVTYWQHSILIFQCKLLAHWKATLWCKPSISDICLVPLDHVTNTLLYVFLKMMFSLYLLSESQHTWWVQANWVGTHKYWFWDIAKQMEKFHFHTLL